MVVCCGIALCGVKYCFMARHGALAWCVLPGITAVWRGGRIHFIKPLCLSLLIEYKVLLIYRRLRCSECCGLFFMCLRRFGML